jgi:hypothetical protein
MQTAGMGKSTKFSFSLISILEEAEKEHGPNVINLFLPVIVISKSVYPSQAFPA